MMSSSELGQIYSAFRTRSVETWRSQSWWNTYALPAPNHVRIAVRDTPSIRRHIVLRCGVRGNLPAVRSDCTAGQRQLAEAGRGHVVPSMSRVDEVPFCGIGVARVAYNPGMTTDRIRSHAYSSVTPYFCRFR